jgi:hypothetical protein
MTKEDILKIAEECDLIVGNAEHGIYIVALEKFAKLIAEAERKKIKHFLTATSVSVQTRVYIGDEEISMLKMTHEEIRARGQE